MAAPAHHASSVDARLLSIAADQLRRHGARGVTVVSVAEEAGMTHANVYRYFASKAALIDAVAERWLRQLETTLAAIADSPDPADDKLERLIQGIARGHRELLARDRHLFDVYANAAETARAVVRKHRARLRQLFERVVDEGIGTDIFNPRDRERALAFATDGAYRFINPVLIRLDADMPQDVFDARLGAAIHVIKRTLISGIL